MSLTADVIVMTNKRNEQKNNRPVPDPDLEYIVFKGNANKLKKDIFAGVEEEKIN